MVVGLKRNLGRGIGRIVGESDMTTQLNYSMKRIKTSIVV